MTNLYEGTPIDLSRLPPPQIIEPLDYETMMLAFRQRFVAAWTTERVNNPDLPVYDVENLEGDPVIIVGEAATYFRLLDRARVNDAVRAVLAPLARGTDLDNVAARVNVTRLTSETDAALLRRYLLAFDRPSAGSADRYLYEAFTAWPQMHDAAVIGRAVHGRRGDVVIAIAGPGGRLPTSDEMTLVRNAVTSPSAKPEATSVTVVAATRNVYSVVIEVTLPRGPDPSLVRVEVEARIAAAAAARLAVGADVPVDYLMGAAYGASVLRVRRLQPSADIVGAPYTIPVLGSMQISTVIAQ